MAAERGFGIKQVMEYHSKNKGTTFSFTCNFNINIVGMADGNTEDPLFKCPFRINYKLHRD